MVDKKTLEEGLRAYTFETLLSVRTMYRLLSCTLKPCRFVPERQARWESLRS